MIDPILLMAGVSGLSLALATAFGYRAHRVTKVAGEEIAFLEGQVVRTEFTLDVSRVTNEALGEVIGEYVKRLDEAHELLGEDAETTDALDAVLRRVYPDLPESYSPPEIVELLFDAIISQNYASLNLDDAGQKGALVRVMEKLVTEAEMLKGEAEDTRMKHGHAVDVIQKQSGIIRELQEDLRLAQAEINATKTVANDDSADADRYCDDLRKADDLICYLSAKGVDLPKDLSAAWAEFCVRELARENVGRGPGVEIKAAA